MDIQKPCHLCPRLLYQSGKRCADQFILTKTPCNHYFHPACWQRYCKKSMTSDFLCPYLTCHRTVNRKAVTEISVSRDKSLREEILQEHQHSNQICSPAEEARVQRARAILEEKSRRLENNQQTFKRERRRPIQARPTAVKNTSGHGVTSCTKLLGIIMIAAILGKAYWKPTVTEPQAISNLTRDDVTVDEQPSIAWRRISELHIKRQYRIKLQNDGKLKNLNDYEVLALNAELLRENEEFQGLVEQRNPREMEKLLKHSTCKKCVKLG